MNESDITSEANMWELLELELDKWVAENTQATFWWRDDDAIAPGEKLDRLTELTHDTGLLLAVIPANAKATLEISLSESPLLLVAQHGFAHVNHAPRGQGLGAWELGLHRGEAAVLSELLSGREILRELFGDKFIPVVVPPWNRIAPELLSILEENHYTGVSAFGTAEPMLANSDFVVANAHCDPIRWKEGAVFAGEEKTLMQLLNHLVARRTGQVDINEHTGFLTHHIDLDQAGWHFCEQLVAFLEAHAGAIWIPPANVFGKAV